ncbi:MAG: ABC transporter substrate-binding protein [Firmicutes bacterium]|nr:ABC transporter substrate-binding protein [Bacillota bacterium]
MKKVLVLFLMLTTIFCLSGCGSKETASTKTAEKEIPTLSFAYGTDTHTCLPNVAMKDPGAFANKSVRINPVSDTQFELIKDKNIIARFNVLPSKSGAESATMMAQGQLDSVLCSNTAMLSAYDVGTNIKILSPLQGGGVSMIMAPETDFYGWDSIKKYIESSQSPVKIGYHSAISGPRILIESILKDAGFKLTEDPADTTADVLMVDLKGAQNLLPSIRSGAVDAWVGPSAHPENAVDQGLGKIVMTLADFPPQGKWTVFPCCVLAAADKVIQEHPEVIEALVSVVADCTEYASTNPEKFAEINSPIIGIKKEVIMASNENIVYSSVPSQEWQDGIKLYFDAIKSMGKFTDRLKDTDFTTVQKEIFDFSFVEKANAS